MESNENTQLSTLWTLTLGHAPNAGPGLRPFRCPPGSQKGLVYVCRRISKLLRRFCDKEQARVFFRGIDVWLRLVVGIVGRHRHTYVHTHVHT